MSIYLLGEYLILRLGMSFPMKSLNGRSQFDIQLFGFSFGYKYFIGFYRFKEIKEWR